MSARQTISGALGVVALVLAAGCESYDDMAQKGERCNERGGVYADRSPFNRNAVRHFVSACFRPDTISLATTRVGAR